MRGTAPRLLGRALALLGGAAAWTLVLLPVAGLGAAAVVGERQVERVVARRRSPGPTGPPGAARAPGRTPSGAGPSLSAGAAWSATGSLPAAA
ncbi:hypothetical protein ACFWYW_06115 [Nonomuraea sp. NPDC059023]|uniref:hypothetical protein n=1 Tax=unclassified Nonomuraea TaxID=2593643 RepID=UPI003684AD9B